MTRTTKDRFSLYMSRVLYHAGYTFNSAVRAALLALALLGEGLARVALASEAWFAAHCRRNSRWAAPRAIRKGLPPWGKRVEDTRREWRIVKGLFNQR